MVFLGIGPRGESRNSVDLAQEAADKLVTVLALTECAHFRVEAAQRRFDELIAMQKSLDLDQCPVLTELLDSLYLAIEERTRDTLDVFIETLLDLRNTWSHAISVVAKAPI